MIMKGRYGAARLYIQTDADIVAAGGRGNHKMWHIDSAYVNISRAPEAKIIETT